ncbi:sensor histidine kinase [Thalassomonas actiniarum]|uniref:histidine kinase n=1 Tax=Thalassomonas actiniarum TaxID=485447 RepID=A0AAE9YLT9_9GAMM|nr:HAMP domain-containing histidine kinase [Thalassomonas actiniarum]WDD97381.1 HAMP domain-containing histidine kinase [Thalassomonas actiniarum]
MKQTDVHKQGTPALARGHKRRSLVHYIAWRLLGSVAVIVLLWFFISRAGYFFALDGTAEFYLFEDAENALFLEQEGIAPDILNSGFREFYRDYRQIPAFIREQVERHWRPGQVNSPVFIETREQDIYFLAYQQQASQPVFYLLHRFDKSETVNLAPLFLLVGLLAFAAVLVVILLVIYRLKSQLKLLSLHLKDPLAEQETALGQKLPPLMIRDFDQALQSVKHHYREKQQVIKREREFANFLSHEIRQPLSKLNTNLALLDQLDDLPYASVEIIEDVKQLSEDLNQISAAVLQLWLDSGQQEETIELAGLIRQLSHALLPEGLKQEFSFARESLVLTSHDALVKLLLCQLIKNAGQYADTFIHFHIQPQELAIENDVGLMENCDPRDYGYGLGLVMAKKICQRLNWALTVKQEKAHFSVVLAFGNSRD